MYVKPQDSILGYGVFYTVKKLSGRGLFNYSRPGRDWLVTSRLGTGKSITFFTVYSIVRQS
jgi:hypothetical protein